MNGNKLLIVYSAVLTAACAVSLGSGAIAGQAANKKTSFDEIDVKRINVRENDGTLRTVITSASRSPGLIFRGVEKPHPSGRRHAGMIFFNDEGTENGGLVFGGRKSADGKVSGGGHLSFDQFEQDQV